MSETKLPEDQTRKDTKKQVVKELLVVQDCGEFTHQTGDTYDGFFEAKKKDRIVKMHGPGTYKTAEGDTYTGIWESNHLSSAEAVTISYKGGATYEGYVKDFAYTGVSRYIYPDGCVLKGNFSDNFPVGKLRLQDPNGHLWTGKAHTGYVWLDSTNHFYDKLETTPLEQKKKPLPEPSDYSVHKGRKAVKILS